MILEHFTVIDKQRVVASTGLVEKGGKPVHRRQVYLIEDRAVTAHFCAETTVVRLGGLVNQQPWVKYRPRKVARYELSFHKKRHTALPPKYFAQVFLRIV